MPRKSKSLTAAKRRELLHHIREGMRPGAAGEALGFTRHETWGFIDHDEKLEAEVEEAEREATEHVEEALYQAAVSGNVTAAKMWLDLRQPKPTALVPVAAPASPEGESRLDKLNRIAAGG
jgi:hypothetical protein